MFIAGIDENGLGPKLGPMVVTGALFEAQGDRYDPARFVRALGGASRHGGARVDDSKAVMNAGDMRAGEITVLGLVGLFGDGIPNTADEFLDLVCAPPPAILKRECPRSIGDHCFGADLPLPLFGGTMEEVARATEGLSAQMEKAGVRLASVESDVLCPGRFNRLFAGEEGMTKAGLDLASFEGRMESFHARTGDEGTYLCGKVMNLTYYSPRLSLVVNYPLLRRDERKEESYYHLQGLGEVRFLLDGDSRHLPISVASMFGKMIREIFMVRLNRFFGERIEGHRPVSGYGDPVTKAFIAKAPPVLEAEGIPQACFLRSR
jgi:hypothetical protein